MSYSPQTPRQVRIALTEYAKLKSMSSQHPRPSSPRKRRPSKPSPRRTAADDTGDAQREDIETAVGRISQDSRSNLQSLSKDNSKRSELIREDVGLGPPDVPESLDLFSEDDENHRNIHEGIEQSGEEELDVNVKAKPFDKIDRDFSEINNNNPDVAVPSLLESEVDESSTRDLPPSPDISSRTETSSPDRNQSTSTTTTGVQTDHVTAGRRPQTARRRRRRKLDGTTTNEIQQESITDQDAGEDRAREEINTASPRQPMGKRRSRSAHARTRPPQNEDNEHATNAFRSSSLRNSRSRLEPKPDYNLDTTNDQIRKWLRRKERQLRRKRAEERKKEKQKAKEIAEIERIKEDQKAESAARVSAWMKEKRVEMRLLRQRQQQDTIFVEVNKKTGQSFVKSQTLDLNIQAHGVGRPKSTDVQESTESDPVTNICPSASRIRASEKENETSTHEGARDMPPFNGNNITQKSTASQKARPLRNSSISPSRITLPQHALTTAQCQQSGNQGRVQANLKARVSYDEWIKRKREENEKKRRLEMRKLEKTRTCDPETDELVTKVAKQRVANILASKKRIDTGIRRIDDAANSYLNPMKTKDETGENKTGTQTEHASDDVPLHVQDLTWETMKHFVPPSDRPEPESRAKQFSSRPIRSTPRHQIEDRPRSALPNSFQSAPVKKRPQTAKATYDSERARSRGRSLGNDGLPSVHLSQDSLTVTQLRAKSPKPKLPTATAYRKIKYQQKSWDGFSEFVWNVVNEAEGGDMEVPESIDRPEPVGSENLEIRRGSQSELLEEGKIKSDDGGNIGIKDTPKQGKDRQQRELKINDDQHVDWQTKEPVESSVKFNTDRKEANNEQELHEEQNDLPDVVQDDFQEQDTRQAGYYNTNDRHRDNSGSEMTVTHTTRRLSSNSEDDEDWPKPSTIDDVIKGAMVTQNDVTQDDEHERDFITKTDVDNEQNAEDSRRPKAKVELETDRDDTEEKLDKNYSSDDQLRARHNSSSATFDVDEESIETEPDVVVEDDTDIQIQIVAATDEDDTLFF